MTQKQFPTWLHIFCIILILFVTLSHATTPASLTNQPVNVTFPTAYISFVPVKDTNSAVNYSTETSAEPKTLPTNTDFTNFTTEAYNTTTVEVTTRDYTTAGTTGGTTAANSDNSSLPKYVGFISAGVAVFLYGSNFAPVKKFETGDGKLKSCLFTFFKAMCLKSIPNQALIHVSEYFLYLLLFPIVGMFFQWILCGGALLVGIIVQVIRGTNHFYPLVMIGGLIWETGRSVQRFCF